MSNNIESHLIEDREFKPSKEFSKKARISSMAQYKKMHRLNVEHQSCHIPKDDALLAGHPS